MSNPVEERLTAPSEADIEKIVNERVQKALAEKAKEKDFDMDKVKAEAEREEKEKQRQNEIIREEAKRVAYLDSIRVDEIKDEVVRKTVSAVIASQTTSTQEKCHMVSRLITASEVSEIMQKIESLAVHDKSRLSDHSVNILKNALAKGDNLTASDIEKAKDAMLVINECIKKIGDEKIAQGMADKVDYDKLSNDKKIAYISANKARSVQEKRNETLNKLKERLGVA